MIAHARTHAQVTIVKEKEEVSLKVGEGERDVGGAGAWKGKGGVRKF